MSKFFYNLERKFGRYAVPDLIRYIVVLYCAGALLGMVNRSFYYEYLSLNFEAVFRGQVWRLFTYLIEPYGFDSGMGIFFGIIFFAIQVNLFFLFGRSLERAWGSFRFNLYIISGYLLNIAAALILYLSPLHSTYYEAGFRFIYLTMFFPFVLYNPEMEFLVYFVLPVKAKWLALLDAVYVAYLVLSNLVRGIQWGTAGYYDMAGVYISIAVAVVVAMANFLFFFFVSRDYRRISPQSIKRRQRFKRQIRKGNRNVAAGGARHRCAVCGRTELDNAALDFRYCSKCEGNFEYCSDHLYTHQHVIRQKE